MRGFEEFHILTEEQKKELWNKAIFVFDANVLLNFYRYTEETANDLMAILKSLKEKVWIPHQVALEYNFNRRKVILEQMHSYKKIESEIDGASNRYINDLQEKLKSYKKRHPRINFNDMFEKIEQSISKIKKEIEKSSEEHPQNYLENDPFYDSLSIIFDGKIGDNEYNQEKLNDLFKEGETRYKACVPPGYEDTKEKSGKIRVWDNLYYKMEYGDLLVWKQIINKASKAETPVVFITDDEKEDWWQIISGRTIGPRFELLNEFKRETEQDFYMYKTYQFMGLAKDSLNSEVSSSSIQEVQELETVNNEFKGLNEKEKEILRYLINSAEGEFGLQNAYRWAEIRRTKNIQINKNFVSDHKEHYEFYIRFIPFENLRISEFPSLIKKLGIGRYIEDYKVTSGDLSPTLESEIWIELSKKFPRSTILENFSDMNIFRFLEVDNGNY